VLLDPERAELLGDAAHRRLTEHYLPDSGTALWMKLLATVSSR
jgi:hypothetical protein